MDNQPNLKRTALLVIGGALTLFLLSWLWHYYHTGKIIITTGNRYNTITLTKTGKNGQKTGQSFKAHNKLSVNVSTGKYSASVSGNSIATVQTISLKPRATLRYTINPINATGVEPVAYESAQAIAATAHQLVYLDASSDKLWKIDSQNNLSEIGSAHQLQTVKWANPSFGVGQDHNGYLHTVINGSVSPLKVPFSYDGKAVNFDVSPDKNVYVSYGADVYAGHQTGDFKKIYTAPSDKPELAAGANTVAVSNSKYGQNSSSVSKASLTTVNVSGKKSTKDVEAERLAWSPNGQYLASVNETNPTIYDAALHAVTTVPIQSTIGQLAWLNNTTLLYTLNDQLWTYSLPQQKAQLLANMPLTNSITGLYTSEDRSYIYVTTLDSNSGSSAIKRIGLKGQEVPDFIYQLQDVLPVNSGSYMLGLINFSGSPVILIRVIPSVESATAPQQAIQQLQSQGFDTSKLQFSVEQFKL